MRGFFILGIGLFLFESIWLICVIICNYILVFLYKMKVYRAFYRNNQNDNK